MKNPNKVSDQDLIDKAREVLWLKMELQCLEMEAEIDDFNYYEDDNVFAGLDFESQLVDIPEMEIELDLSDLLKSPEFLNQVGALIVKPKTKEQDLLDFLDNVRFGTQLIDPSFIEKNAFQLAQDELENMPDPYDEEYYYVILDDVFNKNGKYLLLGRNDEDFPIITDIEASSFPRLIDIIQGEDCYMFTEREIKRNHAYLWPMRMEA